MALAFCYRFALLDEVLPARCILVSTIQDRTGFEGIMNLFPGFSIGVRLDQQPLPPLDGLSCLNTTANPGVTS